jgi:pyruvate dehydrogenase E2 component (dihydrolipoamide acetyltransferase)
MEEGVFGGWLKSEGESIAPGEPLFELEGDKSMQEVEAIDAGILRFLPDGPQKNDPVRVGDLVGFLLERGEEPPTLDATQSEKSHTAPSSRDPSPPPRADSSQEELLPTGDGSPRVAPITPRAARLARELGVDWTRVLGTGRSGRIRERDIREAHTESGSPAESSASEAPRGLRKTIARRLHESTLETAAVTLTTRVRATSLVALRRELRADERNVAPPAVHDIFAKVAAGALRRHPSMNAQWTDAGLIQPDGVHIGIAVDSEHGLFVPVLRSVDRCTLDEIANLSLDLTSRARERKCTRDELSGGTFTISNLGAYGIDAFTPIINRPETAILGLGAIRTEPVVLDGEVTSADQVTLSLTFDHRVVDGAPAARFLDDIRGSVEDAERLRRELELGA